MGRDRKTSKPRNEPDTPPVPSEAVPAPTETKPAESVFPVEPSSDTAIERLSFKLTSDGKIDTGSMRTGTAAKFKGAVAASLKDSEFKKWAGITPDGVPPVQIMSPQAFGTILDMTTILEAQLMAKKFALDIGEVRPLVAYTPDEHRLLDAQGAACCNKYIPIRYLNFADLLILGTTFLAIENAKMKRVDAYAKAKLEKIGRALSPDEKTTTAKPNGQAEPAMPVSAAPVELRQAEAGEGSLG